MKITTKSGFKCTVNEELIKDWRFITNTAKIAKFAESKEEIEIINAVNDTLIFLLGQKDSQRLIEHIAKKNGVADIQHVALEYGEIVNILKDAQKKSESSSV